MENPLLNIVAAIATGSAVIKFALFEWESIVDAWTRVHKHKRPANVARRCENSASE